MENKTLKEDRKSSTQEGLSLDIVEVLNKYFPYIGKEDRRNEAVYELCEKVEAKIEQAKQEGIRKVVEWVEGREYAGDFFAVKAQREAEWQARLKEWGVG